MTKEEADKVLSILETADGGCGPCIISLLMKFKRDFPEFTLAVTKKVIELDLSDLTDDDDLNA